MPQARSRMPSCPLALALAGLAAPAAAGMFSSPEQIAQARLGHDAADLLMQWPVDDSINFSISENPQTKETAYTYYFSVPAHYTFNCWTEQTDNIVSIQQGIGRQAGRQAPIFEQVQHADKVYHPEQQQCNVTFVADTEGILTRYDFRGSNCTPYFRKWGKPE